MVNIEIFSFFFQLFSPIFHGYGQGMFFLFPVLWMETIFFKIELFFIFYFKCTVPLPHFSFSLRNNPVEQTRHVPMLFWTIFWYTRSLCTAECKGCGQRDASHSVFGQTGVIQYGRAWCNQRNAPNIANRFWAWLPPCSTSPTPPRRDLHFNRLQRGDIKATNIDRIRSLIDIGSVYNSVSPKQYSINSA